MSAAVDVRATKAVALRAWEESVNADRPEVADEVYAERFEFHDPAHVFLPGVVDAPARIRATVADLRRAFPDLTHHVEDVVGAGDQVVLRWRQTSRHRAPLVPGATATGQPVEVTGMDWFWVSDGRIVREIAEWDLLGMLRQIGLVPSDGGRGRPAAVPAPPRGPATAEDAERNAATARRLFAELLGTGGDLDGVYAEDAWFLDPGAPAPIAGRAAIAEFVALVRRTVPDLRYEVTGVLAEGDRAVVRWAMTGTHTGEGLIPGLPPTGYLIEATGMDWMLFRDGRIVEERSEWDVHRALGQLGMIPPPQAG